MIVFVVVVGSVLFVSPTVATVFGLLICKLVDFNLSLHNVEIVPKLSGSVFPMKYVGLMETFMKSFWSSPVLFIPSFLDSFLLKN